jgi:hypothetical protein
MFQDLPLKKTMKRSSRNTDDRILSGANSITPNTPETNLLGEVRRDVSSTEGFALHEMGGDGNIHSHYAHAQ